MKSLAALIAGAALMAGCDSRREPAPKEEIVEPRAADASASSQSIIREEVVNEVAADVAPERQVKLIVRFNDDGAIDDRGRSSLNEWLSELTLDDVETVVLRGHTDSRGPDEANRRASRRRAETVRDFLVESGIDEDRITIVALGEDRPIAPNSKTDGSDYPEGRKLNRRVEIEIAVAPADESAGNSVAGD